MRCDCFFALRTPDGDGPDVGQAVAAERIVAGDLPGPLPAEVLRLVRGQGRVAADLQDGNAFATFAIVDHGWHTNCCQTR